MMIGRSRITGIFFISLFMTGLLAPNVTKVESAEPIFTLVAKTWGGSIFPDYLNFLKQHLARIRINVDVVIQEWPTFVGELTAFRDFDICCVGLGGSGEDPDMTGVYDENGTLNMFGYHTSMDLEDGIGTGLNEWYMKQGTLIMPPDSEERVQHYWAWEQYLMDKICPMKPLFTPIKYEATWSNLYGYDLADGLIQSWGKMGWSGSHTGQVNANEVVIARDAWADLNPLFNGDFISKAILDPLIWYDADLRTWPHLATSWTMINDTHFRINLREGIKWQTDPDGLFPNEFLDVDDVYFTLYAWKTVSSTPHLYEWIKDMEKIDQYTLDIFIDGNSTSPENNPYAPFLERLNVEILPEHYLNQSQLADGKTPDIIHSSWNKFTTDCFGTSMFEINDFTEGVETTLQMFEDCWLLDPLVNKSNMDFGNRFGDFSSDLNCLRIKVQTNYQTSLLEFEIGKLDIVSLTSLHAKRDQYISDPNFMVYNSSEFILDFFGYNMRENRAYIGSRTPCPNNASLSVGLAIRKAISYAIDRVEINKVMYGGEFELSYHPIYNKMGIWCNPNIIRYEHDLDKAREYMIHAGFDGRPAEPASGLNLITYFSLISIAVSLIIIWRRKRIKI